MRIALVTRAEDRDWQSCRSITNGLREAYRRVGKKAKLRETLLSAQMDPREVSDEAQEIARFKPDLVVFLDTWPFYGQILSAFEAVYGKTRKRPVLRFHVYGDFTLRAFQWKSWESLLRGFRVEWACASEPQRKLVNRMIMSGQESTWVCPFPIDMRRFRPSRSLRTQARKLLGVLPGETLVLYAGRLSLQKNVLAALRTFSAVSPDLISQMHFVLVGDFDDLSAPFSDVPRLMSGGFYQAWQAELAALPSRVAERVQVIPAMSQDRLAEIYSAADVFFSLSLVHDEDFGLAVAEAAASGASLVLSRWGGYLGFELSGLDGQWIRVELDGSGPMFQLSDAVAALEQAVWRTGGERERLARSRKAGRMLSVQAVTRAILERNPSTLRLEKGFEGMTLLAQRLASYFDHPSKSMIYPGRGKGSDYEEVYQNYV